MAEIYCVCMNKGGVGKTTIITNLAGVFSFNGDKKILIVDTDGQGNSAISFRYNPSDFEDSVYDVFMGTKTVKEAVTKIDDNIDLLPANQDMNFLEFDLLPNIKDIDKPFHILKNALKQVEDEYDYIFIDTPPSMGLVTGNVLVASQHVLLPFVPEMFNVKGLIRVVQAINDFKESENKDLNILGVIGIMVDKRTTLHGVMLEQAREYCANNDIKFFNTIIPKSIVFANAVAYSDRPAVWESKNSKAVSSYFKIGEEIING
ncbi:chromosome (plasmid) partitioning protein [Bacillus phage FADO]|uniref:Chromosome (Plasmid) partitioning protein n=1 Tax=Bacillus phage FADO TaxID=2917160 RepID=A0AAE9K602_9CAUD|nr:chromosome (plasmid) partitioning protein [Bacillus phage FADO]UNY48909.1 chromosome (plasmid) partitioning protein [Bacillus phage FADO]